MFFVPEVLLQSLNDLPRSESDFRKIELSDVDTETGHIIAHFLYTGTYQLPPTHPDHADEESLSKPKAADFKKGIAAFVAAKKYGLTELQELAKYETERIAAEISVAQAAHAVGKDTLASLQEDAGWLQGIVLRKAEQTFEENDAIFSSGSFFNGIKSLKLAKLLGQRVADLYRRRILQLRESPNGSYDRPVDAADSSTENTVEEVVEQSMEAPVEEAVEAVVESAPTTFASEVVAENSPASQAIETLPNEVSSASAEETITQPEQELVPTEQYTPDDPIGVPETASLEPIPSEPGKSWRAHYEAKTGPFEGLSKTQRLNLKKKLKAEAAAKKAEEGAEAASPSALVGEVQPEAAEQEIGATYTAPIEENVTAYTDTKEENGTAYTAPIEKGADVKHQDPFAGLSKSQKKKKMLRMQLREEAAAREKEAENNII